MKQVISLLLIIVVTVMSWSSCAKNKVINVAAINSSSYPVAFTSFLTPTLTTIEINENLNFPQAKVVSEHNRFFELSIIFNEKLQQIIAFYTRSNDQDTVDNSFPSFTKKQSTGEVCQETG